MKDIKISKIERRMSEKARRRLDMIRRISCDRTQLVQLVSANPQHFNSYDRHKLYREMKARLSHYPIYRQDSDGDVRDISDSRSMEKKIDKWRVPEIADKVKIVPNRFVHRLEEIREIDRKVRNEEKYCKYEPLYFIKNYLASNLPKRALHCLSNYLTILDKSSLDLWFPRAASTKEHWDLIREKFSSIEDKLSVQKRKYAPESQQKISDELDYVRTQIPLMENKHYTEREHLRTAMLEKLESSKERDARDK